MTRFEQGPAHGKFVSIKRLPMFLRVTIDAAGKVDALDQLDDEPRADEKLFVYRMIPGSESHCFVDGRDPKTGKRWGRQESGARYRFVESQPDDETLRDKAKWGDWVQRTYAAETIGQGEVTLLENASTG